MTLCLFHVTYFPQSHSGNPGQESHSDLIRFSAFLQSLKHLCLLILISSVTLNYISCKCRVCSIPSFSFSEPPVYFPLFKVIALLEIGLHFPVKIGVLILKFKCYSILNKDIWGSLLILGLFCYWRVSL